MKEPISIIHFTYEVKSKKRRSLLEQKDASAGLVKAVSSETRASVRGTGSKYDINTQFPVCVFAHFFTNSFFYTVAILSQ